MAKEQSADLALLTILEVGEELGLGEHKGILADCYQIEKKHQFSNDRTRAIEAIDYLIDTALSDQEEQ